MIHDLSTQKGRNAYIESLQGSIPKYDNYKIDIEVRDSEGKIIQDKNGNKYLSLSYNILMLTSDMELNLQHLANTLKVFMPDRQINIEVYVKNTISKTYMNMFSFYVNENRFVKH
jgi:hypothetical protein